MDCSRDAHTRIQLLVEMSDSGTDSIEHWEHMPPLL